MAKQNKPKGVWASLADAVSVSAQSIEGAARAVKAGTVAANRLAWAGVAEANSVFAESLELTAEELRAEQDLVRAMAGADIEQLYHLGVVIPPAPATPAQPAS